MSTLSLSLENIMELPEIRNDSTDFPLLANASDDIVDDPSGLDEDVATDEDDVAVTEDEDEEDELEDDEANDEAEDDEEVEVEDDNDDDETDTDDEAGEEPTTA
jgi:hypothetical protein